MKSAAPRRGGGEEVRIGQMVIKAFLFGFALMLGLVAAVILVNSGIAVLAGIITCVERIHYSRIVRRRRRQTPPDKGS